MKFILVLTFCFTLSMAYSNKDPHKVFGMYSSLIAKASNIKVYQIEKYPVVSSEQLPDVMYIYDYGITQVYTPASSLIDSLSIQLLDTTQFLYNDARNCPFVGKYAVEFTKGKSTITLIFSEDPCYKMIVFCPGTDIDRKHIDLGENNAIYQSLKILASNRM
jgi:hypothetical protein